VPRGVPPSGVAISLGAEGFRNDVGSDGADAVATAGRMPALPNCYHFLMGYPIKKCVVCGEEFELKPGKPGFANRCLSCSEEDAGAKDSSVAGDKELNAARRDAMKNLLYRKDS